MPLHPRTCCLLYSISCLLDAFDGYAARLLDQSTRFGAVLDMVTDRCTTTCLLVFLAQAFPRWSIVFQGLISLDLASHYMHMYATLAMGGTSQSHKKVDESRSWILKQYYSNNVSCAPTTRKFTRETVADRSFGTLESTLRLLRHERAILHGPLPPFLLITLTLTLTSSTTTIINRTRQPRSTQALGSFYESLVCRSHGDGQVRPTPQGETQIMRTIG